MPGPVPKRASQRQRTNRTSTAADLEAPPASRVALPERHSPWRCRAVVDRKAGCPLVGAKHDLEGFAAAEVEPHEFAPAIAAWHPRTVAWWATIWDSPMADEWVDADVPGLLVLASLVDAFWHTGLATLASEIRLQQREYGLSPLSRRQLQWEVRRIKATERKAPAPARRRTARGTLHVLASA